MTRSLRAAFAATIIAFGVLLVVVQKQLWRAGSGGVATAAAAEPAGGDSIAIAAEAVKSCVHADGTHKIPCYEKILIPLVDRAGPKLAMGTLMQVAHADKEVQAFGHVYAHAIGIHAFEVDRDVERTFSSCNDSFQSGCYHGVIQAYFTHSTTVDTASVRQLCMPWVQDGVYGWLRFQCMHGMGHGLTMWYKHNLVQSLNGCDLLVDSWDRDSCYGGAFMENVVDATEPDHGMPGMDMSGMESKFKQIDPKDLNYPCTILPERYLTTCYQNQVSIIMYFDNHEMNRVAKDCMNVPEKYRYMCFTGFGTDINSFVVGDHLKAIALCTDAPNKYREWCIIGVVKNIIDVSAKTADGVSFCQKVDDHHLKSRCYEAVGEESVSLESQPSIRETYCAVSEPGYIEACRFGARLTTVPPPGLKAD
ncbi:MAG: hypothetical protein ACREMU_14245 [Gemmatimonadaceae bacterium]